MTQRTALTSKTVSIGTKYHHTFEGLEWTVQVSAIFEDRQRWGWEGVIVQGCAGVETGSKCWGWISELRPL